MHGPTPNAERCHQMRARAVSELRAIFRPLCWAVGHLWEYQDHAFWYCDRCGWRQYTKPEGW